MAVALSPIVPFTFFLLYCIPQMAQRLGVSRQTIHAIETEKYEPSLTMAFRMAHLFTRRIENIFQPDEGVVGKVQMQ